MTPAPPFVPDAFLEIFEARDAAALKPWLDRGVDYAMDGFDEIEGRDPVLAYWRRMFSACRVVRFRLQRQVRDGGVVIVSHRQTWLYPEARPVEIDAIAVYQLKGERIVGWRDVIRPGTLDESALSLWRRLRTARW